MFDDSIIVYQCGLGMIKDESSDASPIENG